ncbi:MAG: Wzz/FepE/Etk N-terminal domain-containing protein [Paracoccaceae bacterium]
MRSPLRAPAVETTIPERAGPNPTDTAAGRQVVWTPPDVLRLLAVLGNNLKLLMLTPLVAVLATVIYLLATSPTYTVGAQLMLRPGLEMTPPATISVQSNQPSGSVATRIEDVTAEVQIMKDPALVHEVAMTLGEDFFFGEDPPVTFMQKVKSVVKHTISGTKAALRGALVKIGLLPKLSRMDLIEIVLQRSIEISPVTRSDIIELSLAFPDPRAGEEVLRTFIAVHTARRDAIFRDTRIPDYFDAELKKIEAALSKSEEVYRTTRATLKGWSIDDQRTLGVERRESLLQMIGDTSTEAAVMTARIADIDRQLSDLPARIPSSINELPNPMLNELSLRRVDLQLKLEAERRLTGSRAAQAQNLEEQLATLDGIIAGQPSRVTGDAVTVTNPLHDSMVGARADAELQRAALHQRLETLNQELAKTEARLQGIDTASVQLARMERDLIQLRASQDRFQRGREEARIAADIAGARISNLTVVAQPQAGIAPDKPRVFRLLLIAAIGALMAATGALLLQDALRPRVRGNSDISTLTGGKVIVRAVAENAVMPSAGVPSGWAANKGRPT